jgi:hypothetical protein
LLSPQLSRDATGSPIHQRGERAPSVGVRWSGAGEWRGAPEPPAGVDPHGRHAELLGANVIVEERPPGRRSAATASPLRAVLSSARVDPDRPSSRRNVRLGAEWLITLRVPFKNEVLLFDGSEIVADDRS